MNIKKFGKRLNKINRLYASITEDGEISAIEKDLLLSYLREAYEYAVGVDDQDQSHSANGQKHPGDATDPHESEPVRQERNIIKQIVSEELSPRPTALPQTPLQPAKVAPQTASVAVEEAEPENQFNDIEIPDQLQAIFEAEDSGDISERLSMQPVKDVSKAMGINEKIFTITELFGGDSEIFNSVVERINGFDDYSEARDYLATGIALDQDWASEQKIKKAEKFIKIVRRKFA